MFNLKIQRTMKDNMNIKTMAIMLALGLAGGMAGYADRKSVV